MKASKAKAAAKKIIRHGGSAKRQRGVMAAIINIIS
jgi:hypothetical protein